MPIDDTIERRDAFGSYIHRRRRPQFMYILQHGEDPIGELLRTKVIAPGRNTLAVDVNVRILLFSSSSSKQDIFTATIMRNIFISNSLARSLTHSLPPPQTTRFYGHLLESGKVCSIAHPSPFSSLTDFIINCFQQSKATPLPSTIDPLSMVSQPAFTH